MLESLHDFDVLSLLFERSDDAVVVCNAEAEIVLFNAVAAKIYGNLQSVALADCPAMFGMHLDDGSRLYRWQELPMARALRGEEVRGEAVLLRANNRPQVRVKVDAFPVRAEGKIVGAMVRSRPQP